MIRLITDFDGPIVDVSERYYHVYQACLAATQRPDQSINLLSKSEFWQLKRSRVPEGQIGLLSGLDEVQAPQFARLRFQNVHSLDYLVYDRLLPGVREALEQLQQSKIDLVLLTLRRKRELEVVLENYDLGHFFLPHQRYSLSNDYQQTTDVNDKTLLMKQALAELPSAGQVWMVGDTEADIVAAKTHQIPVIAVLSGIRDRPQLERYEPERIVSNFSEAAELILSARLSVTSC